ncbi:MAG: 50S ribosomal protein L16 [Verrucomicrobia bacterium GWF2_51_19]|nr:MAG: 50S ribosomal protein L16 [Verrucomicrobia bacterium GWF2_51_19]HCJ12578.1 50S ribosomal protein L16 [Opitutae bacterium]
MANILPAKTKYRKVHKGRNRGNATSGNTLAFGDFAIQALERASMTASQLEAARVAITRHLKRKGRVWMRVFPQKPVTKKPAETRMGKGKGPVEFWAVSVRPGNILFEVSGAPSGTVREAMRLADRKLPFRCRFVSREEQEQY